MPSTIQQERWCFTDTELTERTLCRREDEFLAAGAGDSLVIIYRNGRASNRYFDGTIGVTAVDVAAAESDESPYHISTQEIADNWCEVNTLDGNFVSFA